MSTQRPDPHLHSISTQILLNVHVHSIINNAPLPHIWTLPAIYRHSNHYLSITPLLYILSSSLKYSTPSVPTNILLLLTYTVTQLGNYLCIYTYIQVCMMCYHFYEIYLVSQGYLNKITQPHPYVCMCAYKEIYRIN